MLFCAACQKPPAEDTVPKILHLGDVRYDMERGEMWQGEALVRLTATEIQLMRIFAANTGEPSQPVPNWSRTWDAIGVKLKSAQSMFRSPACVARSRADPKQPRYLQTVRGAGYMLAPD